MRKSLNEREDFFSLERPKNFFINTTSKEKANKEGKSLNIPKSISNYVECLSISTEVQTTLGTKHSVTKSV